MLGSKDEFHAKASIGTNENRYPELSLDKNNTLVRHFNATEEILIEKEMGNISRAAELRSACEQIGCELAVPLVSQGRLIGILTLGAKRSGGSYSLEDLELVSTLVNQAVMALDNARLYGIITDWGSV